MSVVVTYFPLSLTFPWFCELSYMGELVSGLYALCWERTLRK